MRVRRVSRVVADLDRAEAFYCDALGFLRAGRANRDPATLGLAGDDAEESVLRLGDTTLALVWFAVPGASYPHVSASNDLWFQHIAVVVADMDAAYFHLQSHADWRPISTDGPQTLPPRNGRVRAFKFRDPDGHPVELLWFPPGQGRPQWQHDADGDLFLGIDHSALAVSDARRSRAFYEALGFAVSDQTLNGGPAQSRLDAIDDARLTVTSLRLPADPGIGLELLGYDPPGRPNPSHDIADQVTDWITIEVDGPARAVRDPDGHLLILA